MSFFRVIAVEPMYKADYGSYCWLYGTFIVPPLSPAEENRFRKKTACGE